MEVYDAPQSQSRPIRNKRRKLFTLEHANRTIPLVKRIVADMVKQYKRVSSLEERCHIRRPDVSQEEHHAVRRQYEIELDRLRDLYEELTAIGCELKDWRMGLVDFPAIVDGREVELCWRHGEERIGHFHEIGAGYSGRRPLGEVAAAEPAHQA
ncbi:MAG: DUF2203 domain-containing protein [Planctomycetota bacterium]|nr:MAG: DUF2203 domain-containing protein [Planctomycetota bacterium]